MAQRDVLIADDDPKVRELLQQIFTSAGHTCQLAGDGREALRAFKAWRPPLVVTDPLHPWMTGIELLQRIRQEDPDTAVIFVSGFTRYRIASLKSGAYAFIEKPVTMDELLIAAERAMERRWLLIERRQHQQACGHPQETDRTTLGRADLAQRDVLILVVEEDRTVRETLRRIFDSAGYRCMLAGGGEEGLEAFRGSRPSLVIADLRMPMVRGSERVSDAGIKLLRQIRQEDPDAAVIVASGAPDVKTAIASLKLGAHAFIMKPINMEELLITVERALERRQLLIEHRHHRDRPARPSSEQGS